MPLPMMGLDNPIPSPERDLPRPAQLSRRERKGFHGQRRSISKSFLLLSFAFLLHFLASACFLRNARVLNVISDTAQNFSTEFRT